MQIWGRIAEDKEDSLAVEWFHGNYKGSQSIKGSQLTGRVGNIGRIYHRMYPHYFKTKEGEIKPRGREYIEILTIFPDRRDADDVERRLKADNRDFENFCDFDHRITNPNFTLEEIEEEIKIRTNG